MKLFAALRPLLLLLLFPLLTLSSCSNEANDTYAHERAFLKFAPVSGVIPLLTAVQNNGLFCSIRLGTNTFEFRCSDGSTATYPYTADIKNYGQPQCVSGFVVGHSSLPDLNMNYPLLAYDLVCPNCYEQSLITPTLSFSGQEELSCSRCKRTYDLQQNGIVKSGEAGRSLLRYRGVTFSEATSGGILVIMN